MLVRMPDGPGPVPGGVERPHPGRVAGPDDDGAAVRGHRHEPGAHLQDGDLPRRADLGVGDPAVAAPPRQQAVARPRDPAGAR